MEKSAASNNSQITDYGWVALRLGSYVGLSYCATRFFQSVAPKVVLAAAIVAAETKIQRMAIEHSWKPLLESGELSAIFNWQIPESPENALQLILEARQQWGETTTRPQIVKIYQDLFDQPPSSETKIDQIVADILGGHQKLRAAEKGDVSVNIDSGNDLPDDHELF